jgi:hypothetical protein
MKKSINYARLLKREVKRLVALEKERELMIADYFPDMAMVISDADRYKAAEIQASKNLTKLIDEDLGEIIG